MADYWRWDLGIRICIPHFQSVVPEAEEYTGTQPEGGHPYVSFDMDTSNRSLGDQRSIAAAWVVGGAKQLLTHMLHCYGIRRVFDMV